MAVRRPNDINLNCSTDMPRKKRPLILAQPVREGIKAIKVRLDAKTIITLSNLKALDFWKQRYPKLEVLG